MILKNNKELLQKDFINEKELELWFNDNLSKIISNNIVVKDQFSIGSYIIDTLAFDTKEKCFNIIEYKNVRNHSLIDQGFTYLRLLQERKADFVLQLQEKIHKQVSMDEIAWDQTRIVFVSPVFTPYQLDSQFKDMPFDLYKVQRYNEGIIVVDKVENNSNAKLKESNISIENKEVLKQVKVYNEEDYTNIMDDKLKEIYFELKNKILELDDIDVEYKACYIAFKGRTNIVDFEVTKHKLRLAINVKKGNLEDPLNLTTDITNIGHWGNGDYRFEVSSKDDIDKALPFIKQSIKINKK